MQSRILILGGGITGLAAAAFLKQNLPQNTTEVQLWETRDQLGGVLRTVRTPEGFLVELSADNFLIREPWGIDLAKAVGIGDEIISTRSYDRRASVLCEGKIVNVPEGFVLMSPSAVWPMLTTRLLSWSAKARLAGEWFVPPRPSEQADESLASFARRRFGNEVFERLIQPLIGGIYTADPEKLSLAATLPRFLEMERKYGSLLRATLRGFRAGQGSRPENKTASESTSSKSTDSNSVSGAGYNQFVAPRLGMSQFVEAIERYISDSTKIALRRTASRVEYDEHSKLWKAWHADSVEPEIFAGLIVTTPAPVSARLLENVSSELASELRGIEYAGCNVVILAFEKSQFPKLPDGFGMVVPAVEDRKILAVSYASEKFADRAPEGKIMLRVFVGGALQPELLQLSDEELVRTVTHELQQIYGINGVAIWSRVSRWSGAMPQYHLGHLDRVARIEKLVEPFAGLALAGAAFHGVGIPQCIRDGQHAAERIVLTKGKLW